MKRTVGLLVLMLCLAASNALAYMHQRDGSRSTYITECLEENEDALQCFVHASKFL